MANHVGREQLKDDVAVTRGGFRVERGWYRVSQRSPEDKLKRVVAGIPVPFKHALNDKSLSMRLGEAQETGLGGIRKRIRVENVVVHLQADAASRKSRLSQDRVGNLPQRIMRVYDIPFRGWLGRCRLEGCLAARTRTLLCRHLILRSR